MGIGISLVCLARGIAAPRRVISSGPLVGGNSAGGSGKAWYSALEMRGIRRGNCATAPGINSASRKRLRIACLECNSTSLNQFVQHRGPAFAGTRGTQAPALQSKLIRTLKVLFRELAKRVGDGMGQAQRDRPVADRLPSEATADPVDGAVGGPARRARRAGAAVFIGEPERQLELHVPQGLEVRHGDRQQRDELLVRVIREHAAHQLPGDLGEDRGCRNRRIERHASG